jgi:hypothetical protein
VWSATPRARVRRGGATISRSRSSRNTLLAVSKVHCPGGGPSSRCPRTQYRLTSPSLWRLRCLPVVRTTTHSLRLQSHCRPRIGFGGPFDIPGDGARHSSQPRPRGPPTPGRSAAATDPRVEAHPRGRPRLFLPDARIPQKILEIGPLWIRLLQQRGDWQEISSRQASWVRGLVGIQKRFVRPIGSEQYGNQGDSPAAGGRDPLRNRGVESDRLGATPCTSGDVIRRGNQAVAAGVR